MHVFVYLNCLFSSVFTLACKKQLRNSQRYKHLSIRNVALASIFYQRKVSRKPFTELPRKNRRYFFQNKARIKYFIVLKYKLKLTQTRKLCKFLEQSESMGAIYA